jgi:flagellin-specific chaperone FliS
MGVGLSPETVDNGLNQADFATTVLANNVLLTKRTLVMQDKFTPQLTDHVKIILENDFVIKKEIINILRDNIKIIQQKLTEEESKILADNADSFYDYLYDLIINLLNIGLPKPDVTTVENKTAAYEQYSDALEKAIDSWINSDFLNENVVGQIGMSVDSMKSAYKSYFLRQWQTENNYLPEIADITITDEHGKSVIDIAEIMTSHNKSWINNTLQYIDMNTQIRLVIDKKMQQYDLTPTETPSSSSEESPPEENPDGEDFGGEFEEEEIDGSGKDDLDTGEEDSDTKTKDDKTEDSKKENTDEEEPKEDTEKEKELKNDDKKENEV